MVARLHPQLVKLPIRPTIRDLAARKYWVCFLLSLFSDNACIRSCPNLSFTLALSSPIIWLPSLWYILHVRKQKYTYLFLEGFLQRAYIIDATSAPPRGHMHRCTFRILGRISASRGWFRNRLKYCCQTPPQTNDDNRPRLAFGVQLIEILMNPRSVWLHGKYTPSSRSVFGLL